MNRRDFIKLAGVLSASGFGQILKATGSFSDVNSGKIRIKKDPDGILDLHSSLSYKILSRSGDIMSDGLLVPGLPDGMGAFNSGKNIVLIRNHELSPFHGYKKSAFNHQKSKINDLGERHYNVKALGGTTNIVLERNSKNKIKEFLSLSGTHTNCAGGVTPWGSWLSCEEYINKRNRDNIAHGYVFEVDPEIDRLNTPVPLIALGRFNHEAVAFDQYENAYLTEDRRNGLIYKFIPENRGSLSEGKLFAMKISSAVDSDSRNWKGSNIIINKKYNVEWVKIEDHDPDEDTMRYEGMDKGATPFARPEGMISDGNDIFICCTSGGPLKKGQIWKLTSQSSKENHIELWYEVGDHRSLNMPDNITIAPWGDLIVCEDNSDINRLWGVTAKGKPYLIAENSYTGSEFAGVCFSPTDNNTMFVNIQGNGITLSIDGDWNKVAI